MKHLAAPLLLLAAALCDGGPVCLAQNAGLKPPPKRNYKYEGKVISTYEKEKDLTVVLIQLMPIKEGQDPNYDFELRGSGDWPRFGMPERLDFSIYFSYPGRTLATPEQVLIGFLYVAFDPQSYESHSLTAKIDGEEVDFGTMRVLRRREIYARGAYKPYTGVHLETSIPYETLLRMANARKVKMKLGKVRFDLNKDHMEAIRDLASRTVP